MSNDQNAVKAAEASIGALQELARRGGQNLGHPQGMGKLGEWTVKGAAAVAPAAVATAAVGTKMAIGAAIAAGAAVAPFALVAATGYGTYRLVKWLSQ